MNALDAWISFSQVMIMSVGTMSGLGQEIQSRALSIALLVLVVSVFAISGILISKAALQLLTNDKSAGSWCFDCFIDHYGVEGWSS